jgi:hypothetical protein
MPTTGVSASYLALDNVYDPVFDPGASLVDAYAVAQDVKTRLNMFMGEWWENLNLGLPMFQTILGQAATAKGLTAMQLAVQTVILGTQYVSGINSLSVQFNQDTLALSISASVTTVFGVAPLNLNVPGLQAALEG